MFVFLKVPKVQIAILLLILFCLVAPRIGLTMALPLILFCLVFTVASDLLFTYIRKRSFFIPYAAIVTGLILTLIIDTGSLWYQILLIAASSMAIKNFLRISGRHIFNPAATGLVVGYFAFGLQPSWWGPTLYLGGFTNPLNIAVLFVILAFSYISVKRMRRLGLVVSYLLSTWIFTLLSSLRLSLSAIFPTALSPGVLFYGLLMAPEPMTTPIRMSRQILFGLFVSLVTYLLVQFVVRHPLVSGNLPDVTLVALLLGNLVFFKFR